MNMGKVTVAGRLCRMRSVLRGCYMSEQACPSLDSYSHPPFYLCVWVIRCKYAMPVFHSFVPTVAALPISHLWCCCQASNSDSQALGHCHQAINTISTQALIGSVQSISVATVVTIEGQVVSIDSEEDVFLNGMKVLTGSRRSSTATSSYHTELAVDGKRGQSAVTRQRLQLMENIKLQCQQLLRHPY